MRRGFFSAFLFGVLAAIGSRAAGQAITINAAPVELTGGILDGVDAAGAWVLSADDRRFGGFSGLLIEGERLIAVSDRGVLLSAVLREDDGLALEDATLTPLRDETGSPLTGDRRDAEALARADGTLFLAFERAHRIVAEVEAGRLGPPQIPPALRNLRNNAGIEALATLPDGGLLAIAEAPVASGFPYAVLSPGRIVEGHLAQTDRHRVTGGDIGPDGRLYVSERHYSPAEGVSLRLRRYRLSAAGAPQSGAVETLVAYDAPSGIDNMEAIAAVGGPQDLTLWLLSDDNFNPLQRTLLLRFRVRK